MTSQGRDWYVGVRRYGPHLMSALLCVFIVLEIVKAATVWRQPTTDVTTPAAVFYESVAAPTYGDRIVAAHLFGVAANPASLTADAAPAPSSLVLDGTLATGDPKRGFAIMHDAGEPAHVFAVGVRQGSVSLQAVYQDHVLIDRQGTLQTVQLPRSPLTVGALTLRHVDNAAAARLYVDNRGRTVDKPPGPLDQVVRTVMSYDTDGQKLRGYLVYPIASGDPLRVMGLNPGDLLTEINGTALNDQKRSQELLSSLNGSGPVNVTFERQGQRQTASFDMAEARQAGMP